MNYLEAISKIRNQIDGIPLKLKIVASGNFQNLGIFLRAESAEKGYNAEVEELPFATLNQAILETPARDQNEIFILFPWDFIPELDWRTGISKKELNIDNLFNKAEIFAKKILSRKGLILYISTDIPPLFFSKKINKEVEYRLLVLANDMGAHVLNNEFFSLAGYLTSGSPVPGKLTSDLAHFCIDNIVRFQQPTSLTKILVTDLDNVMWRGNIADDGIDGIECNPDGEGYIHYIYQSILAKLKESGILLAVVSRNDISIARSPIDNGKTILTADDFVEICADYGAKSTHITDLSSRLNLGLDSFLFVDDNPLEIEEVRKSFSGLVKTLKFPQDESAFPEFLERLIQCFSIEKITEEDRNRTDLYRRRLHFAPKNFSNLSNENQGDLSEFLADLDMHLTIHDRTQSNYDRAIQLINKTNQFNINGIRRTEDEILQEISRGSKLISASLEDQSGGHGEILSCLISKDLVIESFVLSCRVFQRRIEYAFLVWIINTFASKIGFNYIETQKNSPVKKFFNDEFFYKEDNLLIVKNNLVLNAYKNDLSYFKIAEL